MYKRVCTCVLVCARMRVRACLCVHACACELVRLFTIKTDFHEIYVANVVIFNNIAFFLEVDVKWSSL